jgi:putative heme degradation protein
MDQYGMPDGLDTPEKHDQYLKDIGLMKQTAVEWLEDEIRWYISNDERLYDMFKKAKEMEKEQIGKAFLNGRIKEIGQGVLFDLQPLTETFNDYYNETFKSE